MPPLPVASPVFRRFWAASATSGVGDYVTILALQTLVVVTLDGGPAQVGLLNAARWLPFLVVGVVVGALVDRMRRRPLLVGADLVRAALLAVIPLLWALDALSLGAVLAVVVGLGTATVVHGAAESSLLPRLVQRSHLQRAHARLDGTDAAAMTAGPGIGGALVQLLGAPLAVLLDVVTYVVSAGLIASVPVEEQARPSPPGVRRLVAEVVDGVRWLYRGVELRVLSISTHGWFVAHAIVGVVSAPYVLGTLDLSPGEFGLVGAAGGLGALAGAAVTSGVGRALGTGRTLIACHAVSGLGAAVMASAVLAPAGSGAALGVMAAGQAAYGLAMGMSNSHEMSYRQLVTPDALQARVNTTGRAVNRAVIVVVSPLAGLLAAWAGNEAGLWLAAALLVVVTLGMAATSFRTVHAPE